jgi:kynureninase
VGDSIAAVTPTASELARHYSLFRVTERVFLTGHSHQAWPDVSFDAQQRAWRDAAEFVDAKWDRANEQASLVQAGFRRLLNEPDGSIALGQNTHELVTRLLSALPLADRRTLIKTDGEFHSIRRQLDRLGEAGLTIVTVAAHPVETLAERMARLIDDHVACVCVSSVLYETAEIVPGLDLVASAATRHGASLLVDAYHHLDVVPFDIRSLGLESAFVTGGGYKYCQLGEGNAFLRVPEGCRLRPILTGWFSEFAALEERQQGGAVRYGEGAARFAGATYDPTSHYRAAAVFAFHEDQGLKPEFLRAVSQRQVGMLKRGFEALDIDARLAAIVPMPTERRAGFLAIRTARAEELVRSLRARSVLCDHRGEILRLGPAPYVSDGQLNDAIEVLGRTIQRIP